MNTIERSAATTTTAIEIDAASSAKAAKRPRGRPPITPPGFDKVMGMCEPGKTRRTHNKAYYRAIAGTALGDQNADDYKFKYLVDAEGGRVRKEILAELGQVKDENEIRGIAAEICERRIKTKLAVELIRQHRTGTSKRGNVETLANEISRAVENYRVRYPGTTDFQIHQALSIVATDFNVVHEEPFGGE